MSAADAGMLGYVGKVPGSRDSDAWFTPVEYVEAARKALGSIDFDPFSSDVANEVVSALAFLTQDDDAFATPWCEHVKRSGSVWMNPPYSRGLAPLAVGLFLDEFAAGTFGRGVVLVNNATETRWFQRALGLASAVCLTDHRIAFWNADGKAVSGNTRGQAFLYFGGDSRRFVRAFDRYGTALLITNRRETPIRGACQRAAAGGEWTG